MVSDDEKRWVVAGLVLNKVVIPRVRSEVEQDVQTEYLKLVASHHHIDKQSPKGRLAMWKLPLKYENINGNDGHRRPNGKPNYKKFNYHVTSHLDFAKLYLQPFMAKFSKFDECDASAILTLLGAVPIFSPATQTAAANVRKNVRNEWAHCVFAKWKEPMFKNCFKYIDLLVRSLGLPNCSQVVSELKDWETKGENLIVGDLVDQTLLTMAQQDIALLKNEVQLLKPNEYQEKVAQLTSLSDRLTALEKKVNENQTKIAANASKITANKSMIAANTKETTVNASSIAANKVGITSNADEIESIKSKITVDSENLTHEIREHASATEDQENKIRSVSERVTCLEEIKVKMDSVGVNTEYYPSVDVPETTLPPMAPHFTGHQKEIDDLSARMSSSPTQMFSIWGSGGFGKSSLAIAVGHRLQEQGIRVWFVSLRGISTVEALIEKLLTFLGQNRVQSQLQALDFLCACFRDITSDTVLILDNVDELLLPSGDTKSKFLRSIQELLQASTNLRIVCTSRETMSYATLTRDVYDLRIGTLEATESVSLLRVLTGDLICKDKESLHLANVCGHAPLGLKLMARIVTQDRVSPSDIISGLATSNILEIIDIEDCPDDIRMQQIFEFTFSRLSAHYQEMFVSLTIFPGSFDAEAAAAVLGKERLSEVKKGLGVLERKSFLEYDERSARFTIHTLLQDFGKLIAGDKNEKNEYKEESRIRHHCYFIQLLEKLNESFLTGQSSDALDRFNKDRDSFIFCILDAASSERTYVKAAEQLINMDIFLDTILWVDKTLSNTMYDNYLKSCEENTGRNSVHYASFLLSKAFGCLHYRTSNHNHYVDQLLSEAGTVIQALPSVPSSVKAKYFCYLGFRKLILSQIEDGVAFLEKAVPLSVITTETIVLRIVALRVLADYFMMQNKSDIATEKIQQAMLLCQNYELLKAIVVIQHAEEGDLDDIGNQQFLAQIFYFLAHFCGATKSIAHVKDSLFLAIRNTDEQRQTGGETLEMAQQYQVYGASLNSIGCTRKALEVHKKALDIRLILLGKDNELTASSYHKLGRTLIRLRDYRSALNCHKQALDIRLKVLGEDNEEVAWSYYNIGFTHSKLGDYSSARSSHQHALDIRLKLHGKVNKDTAWSYNELGASYFKMKDYNNALVSQKEALEIRLMVSGRERGDIARSYNNIGATYSKLGDYNSALNFHRHALDIRLKLHGKDNKDAAWLYNELGSTYLKLEDYDSALKSHEHALEIRLKLFGENNEDTAWSYDNIGVTYYNLGDYHRALYFHGLALDVRLKLLGEDNENTALTYSNLGLSHYKLEKYTSALNSHRHALDIRQKLFKEDNKDTAWSYNNLGVTQVKLGDYSGALNSHRHALKIRLKLFGEDNEDTVLSYINIGVAFYQQRDYNSALIPHKKALDIRLKLLGKYTKHTAWAYNELGVTHFRLGNYISALNFYNDALDIRLNLPGENNEDTAWSYQNIGETHYNMGDYGKALSAHRHALDIRQKLLGEDNGNTAWSYQHIGLTYYKLQDYSNALDSHRHARDIRLKLPGKDNKKLTAWSNNHIQEALKKLNSLQQCTEFPETRRSRKAEGTWR